MMAAPCGCCLPEQKEDHILKRNRGWTGYLIVLAAFLAVALLLNGSMLGQQNKEITYAKLWEMIDAGQVKCVAIRGTQLWGLKTDTTIPDSKFPERAYDFETTVTDIESFRQEAYKRQAKVSGVNPESVGDGDLGFAIIPMAPETVSIWLSLLPTLLMIGSTVLIFFFVHKKNAITENAQTLSEHYSEYELPVDEKLSVVKVLMQRPVLIGMLLIGCIASMPSSLMGILLPLQLKETMGEAGATLYGYLNSLNGFVVIVFTPILTVWLKKLTEIPKSIIGLLLFIAGNAFFSLQTAVILLFVGMFVFTLGEVVTVLGSNPYNSRRVPASHRGRVGGISSVVYSVFSSLTQYLISFMLIATNSNYKLIWWIFIFCGLGAAVLYGFMYGPDKRTFPKLYQ